MPFNAYELTCIPTGKKYLGITMFTVPTRWRKHCREAPRQPNRLICRAILKYGPDNFIVRHVASAQTRIDICEVERLLIKQENSLAPNGYNLTTGGDGAFDVSDHVRKQISSSNTGKKRTIEQRAAQSVQSSATLRGRKSTATANEKRSSSMKANWSGRSRDRGPEFREKMKEVWRLRKAAGYARPEVRSETKAKISASHLGKNHTDHTKAKIAARVKQFYADHGSAWVGRKHTQETREKMVAAHARRQEIRNGAA